MPPDLSNSQALVHQGGCHGKRAYSGPLPAFKALGSARAAGRDEKRAYRCNHCRHWHLTRAPLRMTTGPWPDAPAGLA